MNTECVILRRTLRCWLHAAAIPLAMILNGVVLFLLSLSDGNYGFMVGCCVVIAVGVFFLPRRVSVCGEWVVWHSRVFRHRWYPIRDIEAMYIFYTCIWSSPSHKLVFVWFSGGRTMFSPSSYSSQQRVMEWAAAIAASEAFTGVYVDDASKIDEYRRARRYRSSPVGMRRGRSPVG